MTGIDYEKSIVALICWKQMRGELYRGMSYLAMMLRNRADAGWFEGSIYNNAIAFSNDMGMKWDEFPDSREPQYQQLLQVIDGIYASAVPDRTGGALYCAHSTTADSIAGEITTQVGQYIFFRGAA